MKNPYNYLYQSFVVFSLHYFKIGNGMPWLSGLLNFTFFFGEIVLLCLQSINSIHLFIIKFHYLFMILLFIINLICFCKMKMIFSREVIESKMPRKRDATIVVFAHILLFIFVVKFIA